MVHIPKVGELLTVVNDIVGISGMTILSKGQKVKVRSIHTIPGHYHSQLYDLFIPEKLSSINLENVYGSWVPNTFEETLKS